MDPYHVEYLNGLDEADPESWIRDELVDPRELGFLTPAAAEEAVRAMVESDHVCAGAYRVVHTETGEIIKTWEQNFTRGQRDYQEED